MTLPDVAATLKLRRTKSFKVSPKSAFIAAPVVGEDGIFVADERRDLFKLDRQTLDPIWQKDALDCQPRRVYQSTLLVASFRQRTVAGLSTDSGQKRWTVGSDMCAIWKGRLLAWVEPHRILSMVDLRSGAVLSDVQLPGVNPEVATICGNLLLVHDRFGEGGEVADPVTAVDLTTGDVVWEEPLVADVNARCKTQSEGERQHVLFQPGAANTFLAIRGWNLLAYSLDQASFLWQTRFEMPSWPLTDGEHIYSFQSGRLTGINGSTGTEIYEIFHESFRGAYEPRQGVVSGDEVAFVTRSALLASFNKADGLLRGWYQGTPRFWGLEVDGGRYLVTAEDSRLHVFESRGRHRRGSKSPSCGVDNSNVG